MSEHEKADTWLAQESPEPEIVVVGIPWARHAAGVARAPLAMRDRLHRFATIHAERETGFGHVAVWDAGNWPVSKLDEADLTAYLGDRCRGLPDAELTLFIGGEDVITTHLLAASGGSERGLIRFSGSPEEIPPEVNGEVLIGTRGFASSPASLARSREAGVMSIGNDQIESEGVRMTVDRAFGKLSMSESIHVSVDLDALDPSHAPGGVGSLPGGLTIRQLGEAVRLCGANRKVRSMDFVGADVEADVTDATVDCICHLTLSAVTGYAERR